MYGDAKPNMSIDQCIGTFIEDEMLLGSNEMPGSIVIKEQGKEFCFIFNKLIRDSWQDPYTTLYAEGCYGWKGDQLVWDQSQTESHDFHTVECIVEDGKRKVVLKGDDMAFAMYEEKAENVGVVERWAEQRTSTIPPKPAQNQNGPTFWCVSSVVDFLPMSIAASSTLPTDGTYSYAVTQMGDDNPQTAWVEGADGDGVGESLTFIFSGHPEAGLSIYNGLQSNDALFKANGRVEAFEMWVEGRHVANLMLNDSPGLQVIDMTGLVENGQEVRLVISKVYSGSKYSDTCISEMWVTGG